MNPNTPFSGLARRGHLSKTPARYRPYTLTQKGVRAALAFERTQQNGDAK